MASGEHRVGGGWVFVFRNSDELELHMGFYFTTLANSLEEVSLIGIHGRTNVFLAWKPRATILGRDPPPFGSELGAGAGL